ncbi:MAG TPA: hypothetical protein VHL54_08180 [Actinomycetota bacterium]|nr:hypothetical protein [Actinomycetota bacterium]
MSNWKRRIAALMLAAISILGVACGESDDASDDATSEETPAEEATP